MALLRNRCKTPLCHGQARCGTGADAWSDAGRDAGVTVWRFRGTGHEPVWDKAVWLGPIGAVTMQQPRHQHDDCLGRDVTCRDSPSLRRNSWLDRCGRLTIEGIDLDMRQFP